MKEILKTELLPCGVVPLLVGCSMLIGLVSADARIFTSTDGKQIDGEIIAAKGASVVIKVGTKNFTIPVSRFVEEDRKYIDEWKVEAAKNLIPKLDVKINPGVNNHRDKGGDFDDRAGSFDFAISVENRERGYDLVDATGRLVVLGRSVVDNDIYVVQQAVGMKFSVKEGKTEEWQGQEVRFEFDDNGTVQGGYKYYAYLFELKNSSGTVIYQKASQKKFESILEQGITLSEGDYADATLKKTGRSR